MIIRVIRKLRCEWDKREILLLLRDLSFVPLPPDMLYALVGVIADMPTGVCVRLPCIGVTDGDAMDEFVLPIVRKGVLNLFDIREKKPLEVRFFDQSANEATEEIYIVVVNRI